MPWDSDKTMAEAQLHLVPFQSSWVPRVPNKIKMIGPHWTGSRAGAASGESFRFPWQRSITARYGSTTVCQRVGTAMVREEQGRPSSEGVAAMRVKDVSLFLACMTTT